MYDRMIRMIRMIRMTQLRLQHQACQVIRIIRIIRSYGHTAWHSGRGTFYSSQRRNSFCFFWAASNEKTVSRAGPCLAQAEGSYAPFGAEALPATRKLVKNAKNVSKSINCAHDTVPVRTANRRDERSLPCWELVGYTGHGLYCRAHSLHIPPAQKLRSYADTTSVMIWRGDGLT